MAIDTQPSDSTVIPSSHRPVAPSPLRAWFALVALSVRRQARMRQMVWIALGLLALTVAIVAAVHYESGWGSIGRIPRARPVIAVSIRSDSRSRIMT